MTSLNSYLQDGADNQSRATLMLLQSFCFFEDNGSKTKVARWENFREQGYLVSLVNKSNEQLNIIFFEHRNSDALCAVEWIQDSLNSITIDTAEFGDIYKTKGDLSYSVGYQEILKMAKWILGKLEDHWQAGLRKIRFNTINHLSKHNSVVY